MSDERSTVTLDCLKAEIKAIQDRCVHTCEVIDNAPPEFPPDLEVTDEAVTHKINCYVKGLEAAVHDSTPIISTDINLLSSQFLRYINEMNKRMDEKTAFTAGCIRDLDSEINKLKSQITTAQEAQSLPKIKKDEIQLEHVRKAKETFKIMKNEIHGLLQSLLPHDYEAVKNVLGELMASNLEDSSVYIPITSENFEIINKLRDMGIVALNPYNQFEVKINY